jgi:putative transposase
MARNQLIRSQTAPYHVVARVNNKEPFPCLLEDVWKIFLRELSITEDKFNIKIHSLVIMNNHFHLILSTPDADLGVAMKYFMQSVTKIINVKSGRSGRLFGSKYRWSLIDSLQYLDCAMKYVYRNPVKAGICSRVEEYPFSTLNAAIGKTRIKLNLHPPIGENHLIPHNDSKTFLESLNIPFRTEQDLEIGASLRKSKFKPHTFE